MSSCPGAAIRGWTAGWDLLGALGCAAPVCGARGVDGERGSRGVPGRAVLLAGGLMSSCPGAAIRGWTAGWDLLGALGCAAPMRGAGGVVGPGGVLDVPGRAR